MSQIVLSYLLNSIAKIADVDRKNVHSSLRTGQITLRDLKLRPDTLNRFLPIPLDEGAVEDVAVSIPNPTTAAPLEVRVKGVTLRHPTSLAHPPQKRTIEQVLDDITSEGILGIPRVSTPPRSSSASECAAGGGDAAPSDDGDPTAEDLELDSAEMDSVLSVDLSDSDLHSCRSRELDPSERSGSSDSSRPPSPAPYPHSYVWGAFHFLKQTATDSVRWIWQRQIHLEITDLRQMVPCEPRQNVFFEVRLARLSVVIEPSEAMGAEVLKVVSVDASGFSVVAHADAVTATVAEVDAVQTRVTTVHSARSGELRRRNIALSFLGPTSVTADESSLYALTTCHVTREMQLALPPYCQPHAHLRHGPSLWPYVRSCVLSRVRDRRTRYTPNLSHLRFFASARRRYLQLLDECHAAQDVEPYKTALAECEMDLTYADVILYLREAAQRKNGAQPSPAAPRYTEDVLPQVMESLHIVWDAVRIALPADHAVVVEGVSATVRNDEKALSVADVVVRSRGVEQRVRQQQELPQPQPEAGEEGEAAAAPTAALLLLSASVRELAGRAERRVTLAPAALRLRTDALLSIAGPFVDVLSQISLKLRVGVQEAAPPPPPLLGTSFLVVPRLTVALDRTTLLVDRLSLTAIDPPEAGAVKFGCVLAELSVSCGGEYLVAPVSAQMQQPHDRVAVSPIAVTISEATWGRGVAVGRQVKALLDRLPEHLHVPPGDATAVGLLAVDAPPPADTLERMAAVTQWRALPRAQELRVAGVRLTFAPLRTVVQVGAVTVGPAAPPHHQTAAAHYVRVASVEVRTASPNSDNLSCLTVSVAEGIDAFAVYRTLPPSTVLRVPAVSCRFMENSAAPDAEGVPLASLRGILARATASVSSLSVQEVQALNDGVGLGPMEYVAIPDPLAQATTTRPFRASFIQCSAHMRTVSLPLLAATPFGSLGAYGGELLAFLQEHVLAERNIRLFFSTYSDVALVASASSCAVDAGPAGVYHFSIVPGGGEAPPSPRSKVAPFRPFVPIAADADPVVLLCDVEKLALAVQLKAWQLHVHAPQPQSSCVLSVALQDIAVRLPIQKMDYWAPDVQLVPTVPLTLAVGKAAVSLQSRGAVVASAYTAAVAYSRATEPPPLSSTPTQRASSLSLSESDRGSSGGPELPACAQTLNVGEWSVLLDASHPHDAYVDAMRSAAALRAVGDCFLRFHRVTASQTMRRYPLHAIGHLLLDAEDDVLLMDSCTFEGRGAGHGVVLIAPGTTVVFRKCHFSHPIEEMVREADTAAYFCEDCVSAFLRGVPAPAATSSPTTPAAAEAAAAAEATATTTASATSFVMVVQCGTARLRTSAEDVLRLTHRAVHVSAADTPSRLKVTARLTQARAVVTAAGEHRTVVCETASGEVRCRVSKSRRDVGLICSFMVGHVVLPLLPAPVLALADIGRAVRRAGAAALPGERAGARTFRAVPPSRAMRTAPAPSMPLLGQWEVRVSPSVVPVTVVLPNNTVVASLTLVNAYILSAKKHGATAATLEARAGVHDVKVWQLSAQACTPVVAESLHVGLHARLLAPREAEVDVSLSPCALTLSTEHLRLLHVLARGLATARPTAPAAAVHNGTGGEVVLEGDAQNTMVLQKDIVTTELASAAFRVSSVYGSRVVQREEIPAGDQLVHSSPSDAQLLMSTELLCLANGRRVHVSRTIDDAFVQHVAVQTVCQVRNHSDFNIRIASASCPDAPAATGGPWSLFCLPEALLACPDLEMSVSDGSVQSAAHAVVQAPRGGITAGHCLEANCAPSRAGDPVHVEFAAPYGARMACLALSFARRAGASLLVVSPSAPILRNGTAAPMRVEIMEPAAAAAAGALYDVTIGAQKDHRLYQLQPHVAYATRVSTTVNGRVYSSAPRAGWLTAPPGSVTALELCLDGQAGGPSFVVEAAATAEPLLGGPAVLLTLRMSSLCAVVNRVQTDVHVVVTAGEGEGEGEGEGAGAMPPPPAPPLVLAAAGGRAYVPLNQPIALQSGRMERTEALTLAEAMEFFLQGGAGQSAAKDGFASFLLVRRTARGAEVAPPLVIVNEDAAQDLVVRHVIVGKRDASVRRTVTFVVKGGSSADCTVLSSYGFTNSFSFTRGEVSGGGEFTRPIQTTLSAATMWSGSAVYEQDQTFYRVRVAKAGLCDTAVMSVGVLQPPALLLVNTTSASFDQVATRSATAVASSARPLALSRTTAGGGRVETAELDLQSGATAIEVFPNVFARVRVLGDGQRTVVYIYEPSMDPVRLLAAGHVTTTTTTTTPGGKTELVLHGKLQTSGVSIAVRGRAAASLELSVGAVSLRAIRYATLTVQCSVSGVTVRSAYKGVVRSVVKPFSVDVSVRDAVLHPVSVSVQAFHLSVSPLVITVTDVLLYQLQRLAATSGLLDLAAPADTPADAPSDCSVAVPPMVGPAVTVAGASISEIRLVVSWDRRVSPPEDFLFGGSILSVFIPSLHNATMAIQPLHFRNLSSVSPEALVHSVLHVVKMEFAKQLPSLVGSVSLFEGRMSLAKKVSSVVSSFLFGTYQSGDDETNVAGDGAALM